MYFPAFSLLESFATKYEIPAERNVLRHGFDDLSDERVETKKTSLIIAKTPWHTGSCKMQLKHTRNGCSSESALSMEGTFLCRNGQASHTRPLHMFHHSVNPCPCM